RRTTESSDGNEEVVMATRVLAVLFLLASSPAFAQAAADPAGGPVKVTRILDTAQTRVAEVEIRPNATRPLHSHPEALWHVFVTTDAPMDLLIEGQPTVHLGPWQAHFFTGGTMHGFSNPNARTVRWIELFALKTGTGVAMDENAGHALALGFAEAY